MRFVRSALLFIVLMTLIVGCVDNKDVLENNEKENNAVETTDSIFTDGDVITIGERTFDKDDLSFYTLMNKVKLILEKEATENNLSYFEEQLQYYENVNVNLQSLIELYSMSLLAEEKNYFIPDDKLQKAIEAFDEKIASSDEATEQIEQFGQERYDEYISDYITQVMLRDRIIEDLEKEVQDDHPDAVDQELLYLLEEKYDDLYMAQVASLEVDIHVHK